MHFTQKFKILCAVFPAILLLSLPALGQGLPALSALQGKGVSVSGMIVDLDQGRVLSALSADRSLIPASVTKLYTAALALETWGPDHRFETKLLSLREAQEGELEDLILLGGGDPALTNEDLWALARALSRAGIQRVRGDLVINASLFGKVVCNVQDRCEAEKASRNAYDAPLSAAGSNYGSWTVAVDRHTAESTQVLSRLYPYELAEIELRGEIGTGTGAGPLRVQRHSLEEGRDVIELSGALPSDHKGRKFYRSTADPELQTGLLLRAFLEHEGISIEGRVRSDFTPPPAGLVEWASHDSAPLGQILGDMMRYSNNFMADVLLLDLHAESGGDPPFTVAAAARILQDYARGFSGEALSAAYDPGSILLLDGSGLDPENRLSAASLVALLEHVYKRHPDIFPAFLGSLNVPVYSSGSSLKRQDTDWLHRIAAKTGGLSEPVTVTSLAGYLRFRDGGWGAFAFLVNGVPGQPLPRVELFEAMRQDLSHYWERSRP